MIYGFTGVLSYDKNRCVNDIYAIHASSSNGFLTICNDVTILSDAFDLLIAQLTAQWGGQMSYSFYDFYPLSSNGGERFVSYIFEWKNITTDPSTNNLGLPTLWELGVDHNDCDQSYALLWLPFNTDTPDCPVVETTICDKCLEVSQAACQEHYTIISGLEIGQTYTVSLTDRNNKIYKQDIIANSSGDLLIDATEFPRSFFTPEHGPKSLAVWSNNDLTGQELFTMGSLQYTCIILSFQYVITTTSSMPPIFDFLVDDNFELIVDESNNTFIVSA